MLATEGEGSRAKLAPTEDKAKGREHSSLLQKKMLEFAPQPNGHRLLYLIIKLTLWRYFDG